MASTLHRDGLAEMAPSDIRNMTRRASIFHGAKLAAEFYGRRPTRFQLHGPEAEPADAKLILFVRHGEGLHNAWRASEQAAGRMPTAKRHNIGQFPDALHDPLLTAKGHADAAHAASIAGQLPKPGLLVTSPLRRTVQTMSTVFAEALEAGVPAIAHELCREAFHAHESLTYFDENRSTTRFDSLVKIHSLE